MNNISINGKNNNGFTLLELLVAMLLISLVTLIAAQSMRLALNAWQRSADEEDKRYILGAVPRLLENQLTCLVRRAPLQKMGIDNPLTFFGEDNAFSFYTNFSPQGSPYQGLMRVAYVYNKEKKELAIMERIILGPEDAKNDNDPVNGEITDENKALTRISGVTQFSPKYSGEKKTDPFNLDGFSNFWERSYTKYPKAMSVELEIEGHRAVRWVFRIGPAEK